MLVLAMQFSRGRGTRRARSEVRTKALADGEGLVEHTFRTEQRTERSEPADHGEETPRSMISTIRTQLANASTWESVHTDDAR